jgi:hypothetical protein
VRELREPIEIDATPEAVWEVLVDFASYPDWNPFVRRIEGVPVRGERLRVRIEPPGSRGATVKPRVEVAAPERKLEWVGHLLVPGLFDGRHSFEIEPVGDDRVRFVQREQFSGLLVGLLLDEESVRRGFDAMNRALAERAEETHAT